MIHTADSTTPRQGEGMPRKAFLGVLVSFLLMGCNSSKSPSDQALQENGNRSDVIDQSSPRDVVTAFFAALENDDVKQMQSLASPGMQRNVAKERWRKMWQQYTVKKIGEVENGESQDADSARIQVTYLRPNGTEFEDSVKLERIEGKWFWDER